MSIAQVGVNTANGWAGKSLEDSGAGNSWHKDAGLSWVEAPQRHLYPNPKPATMMAYMGDWPHRYDGWESWGGKIVLHHPEETNSTVKDFRWGRESREDMTTNWREGESMPGRDREPRNVRDPHWITKALVTSPFYSIETQFDFWPSEH